MLRLSACFPDALVGLAPGLGGALGLGFDDRPQPARQALAVHGVLEDRVEHRAVDVVLALVEGPVSDSDRVRAGVARELLAERFGQVAPPVDAVHDLQPAVAVGLDVADELHELVGLPVEPEQVQRLQCERRVAHPRIAVVPVALAPRSLGQRRGQRRDERPGRHVGQALDHQGRALDRLAPAMVGKPRGARQPSPPEADRVVEPRGGVVDIDGSDQPVLPGKRGESAIAGRQGVPGTNSAALDPELEIGLQADRLAGASRVGNVPAAVHQGPFARCTPVVECRLAHQLDLDLSVQACDRPHEHVLRILVRRRTRVRGDHVLALGRAHYQARRVPPPTRAGSSRS